MIDYEHAVKVIPLDEGLGAAVKQLEAEGWNLVPGVLPVVVYQLVRKKPVVPVEAQGALGVIKVDDTKVHVLRDNQVVG